MLEPIHIKLGLALAGFLGTCWAVCQWSTARHYREALADSERLRSLAFADARQSDRQVRTMREAAFAAEKRAGHMARKLAAAEEALVAVREKVPASALIAVPPDALHTIAWAGENVRPRLPHPMVSLDELDAFMRQEIAGTFGLNKPLAERVRQIERVAE